MNGDEIMGDKTSTERAYEAIEQIELRKRKIFIIMIGLFIPVVLGLVLNTYLIMLYSHQKGESNGMNMILIAGIGLLIIIFLATSIKKFMQLTKFDSALDHIREFEDTIRDEVLLNQEDYF